MNIEKKFFDLMARSMSAYLATADGGVTMRVVSPVPYEGGILIFTHANSTKYRQMRENPRCCLGAETFFAEATAEFLGATMLDENAPLRAAYEGKFPGAFDEGLEFGGRAAEFILLRPTRLTGWVYPDGVTEGIPTVPVAVDLA